MQIALGKVQLIKEIIKRQCFNECTIFKRHDDFRKGHLSRKLALKSGHPENVINDYETKPPYFRKRHRKKGHMFMKNNNF